MSAITYLLIFLAGLAVLYVGAESLLKGAVRLARSFGVSPLVIGLTLVAFGTSAPELSLDLTAAFKGTTDLAFGDLVGSNVANIGLILGLAAVIRPLNVQMRLLRREVPIVILVALALWGLAWDGTFGRLDGAVMLAGFAAFLVYSYRSARREPPEVKEEFRHMTQDNRGRLASTLLVLAGLAGLVLAAQLMVYAAVGMARQWGISELVIGLTIVAVGTSLPELATSVVGALRGEADIVIGNIVGSNIFNLAFILALVAQVQPLAVHRASLSFDLPVMAAFTLALLPIMRRGMIVSRGEGSLLLAAYVGFVTCQLLRL